MGDEPDFKNYLSASQLPDADFCIPASSSIPPAQISSELQSRYPEGNVALFIPGRRFDTSGTRHGRGHGWYDRLLALLPNRWVRIGVLSPDVLSSIPLKREAWDQPVDYLLIVTDDSFQVTNTGARPDVLQS